MVPADEIPPVDLFHMLSHTETIKNDVMTLVKITKNSIIAAFKRGMTNDAFLDTLQRLSKNNVPQNLSFLISEWTNQTLQIQISDKVLLKANKEIFIEELLHSEFKKAIVEKITPHYAIIKKQYIEDIIKYSNKKEALIQLFIDSED